MNTDDIINGIKRYVSDNPNAMFTKESLLRTIRTNIKTFGKGRINEEDVLLALAKERSVRDAVVNGEIEDIVSGYSLVIHNL